MEVRSADFNHHHDEAERRGKNKDVAANNTDLPIYRTRGRALGVCFEDVNVFGAEQGDGAIVPDLLEILKSVINSPIKLVRHLAGKRPTMAKHILHDITGVINPGETMLVLGRPGSGCSTTLKILANERNSFVDVQGVVSYASIPASEMASSYASEAVYVAEDDMHFPMLSVKNTLDFALRLRKPADEATPDAQFSTIMTEKILQSLGISHTKDTVVGNAYIRGVSGGERKRVSLAEVLAINPSLAAWDNPIRGLDSSSALAFLQLVQQLSKTTRMSNIVTMYQASEAMYQCFDRVMVLYEGRMIFAGKADQAKQYFIDLGFECRERQTTPDFLTAVTSPLERVVRKDHHGPVPLDPDSFVQAFRTSTHYQNVIRDMADYRHSVMSTPSYANEFREEVRRTRSNMTTKNSVEPRSVYQQTVASIGRYYQLLWSDRSTFYTVLFMNAANAVICGSALYMARNTATGSFEKSGALFFALVYFVLNGLTQVSSTVKARQIISKQHRFGFAHPVAYVLAQTVADIPTALVEVVVFGCCYYFMLGTTVAASNFFIFMLIVYVHYLAIISFFRMLGAWSPNVNIAMLLAGAAMPVELLYSGYAPPVPTQHRWGSWIRRISPSPYGLEALMGNEFNHLILQCTPSELVPRGPDYNDIQYQGCPLAGSTKGSAEVAGSVFLADQYGFSRSHLWRNFGIIIAMWIIYAILTAIGLTVMTKERGVAGSRTYKRGAKVPTTEDVQIEKSPKDLESQSSSSFSSGRDDGKESEPDNDLERSRSHPAENTTSGEKGQGIDKSSSRAFTFDNVNYFVGEKQLLDNISGYVKPGQLTALMGASGAGKTTLLEVVSQRKSEGRVEGSMLFDGKPLDQTFGRACGFCMQQDVHEPLATVKEALQFSAKLRQPAHFSESERNEYVEHVMSLLELGPIADAIIGTPGEGGLGVEERKRVTIGVELAARPSALLFLDEPTSGLDSQAAYSLVVFLRRIAADGVPIICTIHQPSGVIFEMFDHVLLLAPGGKTVYFGETGPNSHFVVDYFARYGAVMERSSNPAEFILSTVTSKAEGVRDWVDTWLSSPEKKVLEDRIAVLNATPGTNSNSGNAKLRNAQFALPITSQIAVLTKRHWITTWRNGFYIFSKFSKSIFFHLFVAFSFFKIGTDLQGLQNHALGILLLSWIIPANAADMQDVWYKKWAIYEAREKNGIYNHKALTVALIAVEIPWQILVYTITFFCFYWTVGYPNTTTQAGFGYFMYVLLSLFGIGFPLLIAAIFPNDTLAGYAISLVWIILLSFSGIPVPHSAMNDFYRPWLFWTDPMRYFLGASVEDVMHNVPVNCKEKDLAVFDPPRGSTCYEYAAAFLATEPGYLKNPNATSNCGYCEYSTGDNYLATLEYGYNNRWRDWAVFLGFCFTTIGLIFIVNWIKKGILTRVRRG